MKHNGYRFKELEAFNSVYGHCEVPQTWPDNPQLGRWANEQRFMKRQGKLSEVRFNKLESLPFEWNPTKGFKKGLKYDRTSTAWEKYFNELVEYKKLNGHLNISQVALDEEIRALGKWLNNQRHFKKSGMLDPVYERRLNELGIAWEALEAKWDERLVELKAFYSKYRHFRVSQKGEHRSLGYWVAKIRKSKPSSERLNKLKDIGFDWEKERLQRSVSS